MPDLPPLPTSPTAAPPVPASSPPLPAPCAAPLAPAGPPRTTPPSPPLPPPLCSSGEASVASSSSVGDARPVKGLGMALPDSRAPRRHVAKQLAPAPAREAHAFEALEKLTRETREAVRGLETATGGIGGLDDDAFMEFRFALRDNGMRAAFQLLHMVLEVYIKDTDERACAYIAGPAPNRWGFATEGKDLFNAIRSSSADGISEPANSDLMEKACIDVRNHPLFFGITLSLLAVQFCGVRLGQL